MGSKIPTPSLAFGSEFAVVQEDSVEFADLIDRMFPGLCAYDPLGNARDFRSQTATIALPESRLVAAAISPTRVERRGNAQLTFMLPIGEGSDASVQIGGRRIEWGRGRGVFLPITDERVVGDGGFRSHLMWHLDRERLMRTAQAMAGKDVPVNLRLDELRLLASDSHGIRTDDALHALLPLLNLYSRSPSVLASLGVEELLYRQTVLLLKPDLLLEKVGAPPRDAAPSVLRARALVAKVCDYAASRLAHPLDLSDLERVSGVSARSLQLAFRAVHGCSPMAWVKEQRLLQVRTALQRNPEQTVESVANATGFHAMPAFFMAYRKRFGETPGAVKSRS